MDIFKIDDSEVVHKDIHGWLYAFSEDRSFPVFWDQAKGLGITGDWLTGGRAENAWKNAKLKSEREHVTPFIQKNEKNKKKIKDQ